jgi:membrane-associated phospholipid phosphatase
MPRVQPLFTAASVISPYVVGLSAVCAHAAVWMIAIPVSFLVGISRVYLGVHWPADAIGGWILAMAWLWVALLVPPL